MSRIDAAATAFGRRDAPFLFGVEANWPDASDDERNIAWARHAHAAIAPDAPARPYPNLEVGDALAAATDEANHERLVALKRRYDPGKLFRTNQHIGVG